MASGNLPPADSQYCRGYSLVFSETGGSFFGNLRNFCFMGVLGRAVPESNNKLPEIVRIRSIGLCLTLTNLTAGICNLRDALCLPGAGDCDRCRLRA